MTQILFFGRLRDVAGCSAAQRQIPDSVGTVAELRAWLRKDDPLLGAAICASAIRVAVDQVLCVNDDESIRDAQEIAFMPPLSGG
jgi:molybdopterin synthase sulfur carrier subunit